MFDTRMDYELETIRRETAVDAVRLTLNLWQAQDARPQTASLVELVLLDVCRAMKFSDEEGQRAVTAVVWEMRNES